MVMITLDRCASCGADAIYDMAMHRATCPGARPITWTVTSELRWKHTPDSLVGTNPFELQQKWISERGESDWRLVPIEY